MWGGKGALEGSGRVRWCEMSREGERTSERSLNSSGDGEHKGVVKARGKTEEVGQRGERLHGRQAGGGQCGEALNSLLSGIVIPHCVWTDGGAALTNMTTHFA